MNYQTKSSGSAVLEACGTAPMVEPWMTAAVEPVYNAETLAAMRETLDIMDGKINVKSYATVEEMNADIDAEVND